MESIETVSFKVRVDHDQYARALESPENLDEFTRKLVLQIRETLLFEIMNNYISEHMEVEYMSRNIEQAANDLEHNALRKEPLAIEACKLLIDNVRADLYFQILYGFVHCLSCKYLDKEFYPDFGYCLLGHNQGARFDPTHNGCTLGKEVPCD